MVGLKTASTLSRHEQLYYIACPYSHKNKAVMTQRYYDQRYASWRLMGAGYHLIQPVEMCHHITRRYHMPSGYAYWKERDRLLLSRCDGIIVVMMDGYMQSVGVQDEVAYARFLHMPVYYFDPFNGRFAGETPP